MISCVFISLIILTSYVITVTARWGLPVSVSQTFFSIRHKWIFSAVMAISFGLILVPLMDALPISCQCFGFLIVGGGLLIAFAPNLDDKMEETVHMTGAVMMGIASQLVVTMLHPWMLLLWIAWLPFVRGKNRVFWAEMIGGGALYAAIIADYFMA